MLQLLFAALALAQEPAPPPQEGAEAAAAAAAPAISPEARALWDEVCAASGSASRAPLTAFQLEAEVRTRNGTGRNEGKIDYRYLAPDCIRFVLQNRNVTGRYGPAQQDYWLQSRDGVVVLAGREYKEDRKQVDDMLALARNYVALSNPARLDLRALELVPPPADLPEALAKRARKLTWLALESPDFALVRSDAERPAGTLYRVELAIRGEDKLPGFAVVREKSSPLADPLLVEFSQYVQQDDFRLPFQLKVHALDRTRSPARFTEAPAQEVYVTSASLRPKFSVADFKPKP